MIAGMTPLVLIHTLISLVGIVTGLVVLRGLLRGERLDSWTNWFLVTTILTSATGFILPAKMFMPSHAVGILSLVILAVCCFARYTKRMAGGWRTGYVVTAMMALYLNVFVLVAQLFLKVPALHALAPQGNEPPFIVAQTVVLAAFIALTVFAVLRFHPERPPASRGGIAPA
jgi:hypothetical protein